MDSIRYMRYKSKIRHFKKSREVFGQFNVADSNGREAVVESIVAFLKNNSTDHIGISVSGSFDYENSISLMKHKLTPLYGVSLRGSLGNEFSHTKVFFIHDAHAFALGVMEENKSLFNENFSCLMLGTGIVYINVEKGLPKLNNKGAPQPPPFWSMPFKDGIAEDYVSTKALIKSAKEKGFCFNNIKATADMARSGNKDLLEIFGNCGKTLGECTETKRKEHSFATVAIGGQISKSFDLMKPRYKMP